MLFDIAENGLQQFGDERRYRPVMLYDEVDSSAITREAPEKSFERTLVVMEQISALLVHVSATAFSANINALLKYYTVYGGSFRADAPPSDFMGIDSYVRSAARRARTIAGACWRLLQR